MSIVLMTTKEQVMHVACAVMMSIHDVFPPNKINKNDPVLEKKLKMGEA
jgi:hypothetical protein